MSSWEMYRQLLRLGAENERLGNVSAAVALGAENEWLGNVSAAIAVGDRK